jgi:ABC-type lipoprotein release transport system permease subunit
MDFDHQWRYSSDRALASLMGFMIVYSTMWGYQLHDRPILDTLVQPSETSSSNYQRLSWRSRETHMESTLQISVQLYTFMLIFVHLITGVVYIHTYAIHI